RLLIFVLIAAHAGSLRAVAPDDPKVQALLEKAIAYLEKPEHQDSYGKMLGGKCLAGLAVYKYRKNAQHPIVLDAVQVCQTYAANPNQQVPNDFNYSLALSIIFLCEVDAQKYSAEIQSLLNWLRARQHPHGFWGYPDRQTGDTSQT